MTSEPVTLPDLPKGKEYEEYIAAYLQTAGYYVERNIVYKEVKEVLELDIVISNYKNVPEMKLIEVKSGKIWGFPDVFKLKGWSGYLNLKDAILIVNEGRDCFDFYKTLMDGGLI